MSLTSARSRTISGPVTLLALLGWVLLSFAAALSGAWFPPDAWYGNLEKPSWNPPNWLFGPVWSVLYLLMGISAWLVWKKDGFTGAGGALTLFLVQLGLNALWTPVFFGMQRPDLALFVIVALLIMIAATRKAFRRHDRLAAWLLVPYLLWVGFATALNAALWRMNGV
jgi:benzodiazapine receptor